MGWGEAPLELGASQLLPETEEWISYAVKAAGFHFQLDRRVPATMEQMAPVIASVAARHGWAAENLDFYAIHAGGPRILDDLSRFLGVEQSRFDCSRETLTQRGNIASAEQLDQVCRITSIAVVENLFNIADQSGQDVLAYAERQGIAYIPWFPLGHGGLLQESGPLAAAARQHGATPAQLALAWLLRRSPVTLPIPGTTSLQHLEQNMKAPEVLLTEGEWASLEEGCLNPVNWPKSLERPGTRAETSPVPRQIATQTAERPAHPSRDSTVSGPGDGRAVQLGGLTVLKKPVNAAGQLPPVFELTVLPGFDVGAHCHDRGEELFYVLEGTVDLFAFHPEESGGPWQRWRSAKGEQIVRASAGGMLVVPEGCPHAFANVGTQPAPMLFQTSTPGHWEYFLELSEVLRAADPDPQTVAELRLRYGITQISPLRPGTGPLAEGDPR
jgi:mannose-6-phosphate isomerase-like protein (cupin superfamily)